MSLRIGVLLAGRFRRENVTVRVDSTLTDRVLPIAGRNYPADIIDGALIG